jgi:hypothetical protein
MLPDSMVLLSPLHLDTDLRSSRCQCSMDLELESIFDSSSCVRKGLCPVTQLSNPLESHSLYYEQHGSGQEKILFIMG